MHKVICQDWTECERGWGQRPAGTTLYTTTEKHAAHIERENQKQRGSAVPESYVVVESHPYVGMVSNDVFAQISKSNQPMWINKREIKIPKLDDLL